MAFPRWMYDQSPPCGHKKTGRNPTERGKQGVKRSLLTDANGLPLFCVVSAANVHDINLVEETLDALQTGKPGARLHLCLDNGYKAEWLEQELKARRYIPHIQGRKTELESLKKEPGKKARRWVVERTHSWLNRYRRLLTRWEKKTDNYQGMLHFSCGLIVWNKLLLG